MNKRPLATIAQSCDYTATSRSTFYAQFVRQRA